MSEESFCENCGSALTKSDRFCKECGTPRTDVQNVANGQQTGGFGQFQPSANQSYQPINIESVVWSGTGIEGIKLFVSNPKESGILYEANNGPSAFPIALISAVIGGLLAYFFISKTTTSYFEVGVPTELPLGTESIISGIAFIGAALFSLIYWYVGSFILSLLIKGSLPLNSPARFNTFAATRRLNAYRGLLGSVVQILVIILLQQESNQIVETDLTTGVTTNIRGFSNTFLDVSFALSSIFILVSSYYLFRALKDGMKIQGSVPLILALLTIAVGFFAPF